MPINWGGMLNLLLLPAVVWAISLCHVYPSSFFLVDIEFGIQDWEEETLKARSVRKGISLLKLGNGSWLLWEQHPIWEHLLSSQRLFPSAGRPRVRSKALWLEGMFTLFQEAGNVC